MEERRPKLGLALSGAAARSVFYLGFIEVLEEHDVLVDVIAAQSGAAVVASAYACNSLPQLKKDLLVGGSALRKLFLVRSKQGGGLYSLDAIEEYGRGAWTKGKHFEDVVPKLCFLATNLSSGELVHLASGDLARSVRITCSVPGLFEPVRWGNYHLVDGGILSFMPGEVARQAGADVVVGVSVRATKHIFLPSQITMKKWYNGLRDRLLNSYGYKVVKQSQRVLSTGRLEGDYVDTYEFYEDAKSTEYGIMKVLGRSLDLAIEARRSTQVMDQSFGCDLLIREGAGKFGDSVNMSKMQQLYIQGRQSAIDNLPHIRQLLAEAAVPKKSA